MAPPPGIVYALDFDGVICDSVNESSQTALRAALNLWPDLPIPTPFPEFMLNALRTIRPVIETGYENVLLARLVSETSPANVDQSFVEPVLNDWASMRDDAMARWQVDKDQLVQVFGSVRDEWIANDLDSWVSANSFFPGVVDALNFSTVPVYIITTKQSRFCNLLLERYGVKTIPEERVYGLGTGTKISVLKKILAMPENKGNSVAFVEDRCETLEAVSISMLGQPLNLFLATWGYNTAQTRSVAEKHPFIELLDLPTFVNKFQ